MRWTAQCHWSEPGDVQLGHRREKKPSRSPRGSRGLSAVRGAENRPQSSPKGSQHKCRRTRWSRWAGKAGSARTWWGSAAEPGREGPNSHPEHCSLCHCQRSTGNGPGGTGRVSRASAGIEHTQSKHHPARAALGLAAKSMWRAMVSARSAWSSLQTARGRRAHCQRRRSRSRQERTCTSEKFKSFPRRQLCYCGASVTLSHHNQLRNKQTIREKSSFFLSCSLRLVPWYVTTPGPTITVMKYKDTVKTVGIPGD